MRRNTNISGMIMLMAMLITGFILISSCKTQRHHPVPSSAAGVVNDSKDNNGNTVYINIGTKITKKITDAQIDFIDRHYDYVMTPFLTSEVRNKIQNPKLLLYRSIQGTWTNFNQFDWNYITKNENMFCHHSGSRIKTIWNSWLMDGNDLVDRNSPAALNHWINYYAVTASKQVYEFNYDGLFIDSASHGIGPGVVYKKMPDDYSGDNWREGRYKALEFIKSYFPDKTVIFNGLHTRKGSEHSLALTDGGMWETFAFQPGSSKYWGEEKWKEVIELTERNSNKKLISMVSKKKHLTKDIQSRMFILSSYLLVSNQNVFLSMADLDYGDGGELLYYPEYEINLGNALNTYTVENNSIYKREFENGIVLAKPDAKKSRTFSLEKEYNKVIPTGGGLIHEDGTWKGSITYKIVNNRIMLPPETGVVLINTKIDTLAETGGCKKWNPGHYILPTSEKDLDKIELILANPENCIVGIQGYFLWRDLEIEKDFYDFSKIEQLLQLVKRYNKHLFVQVSDRTFKLDEIPVPDYLYEDPLYKGGVEPRPNIGPVSRIWDSNVNERFNKLLKKLGRFDIDPNFEGIAFEESALGIDKNTALDFTEQAYADGLLSRNKAAVDAFPNSVVIQYMNWGPDKFLDSVIEQLYVIGAGIGGPDLVPDEGRYLTKGRIPAYDYYPLYAGKMPLGTAVQTPNLMRDDINKKGHFTLDGFWDMGLNTLKLNYIFWSFTEQPWHKFSFTKDILPYINEKNGQINRACPENHRFTGMD